MGDGAAALEVARKAGRHVAAPLLAPPARGNPEQESPSLDLYSGAAGVLVFLQRLARATGDPWAVEAVNASAEVLLKVADAPAASYPRGLYSGLAGIAFALGQHESTVPAAHLVVDELLSEPPTAGDCTDIISGTAGVGLTLLWAAEALHRDDALAEAAAVGDLLVSAAKPAEPSEAGLRWKMRPADEFVMPNFSHGTAGVAFFLARLAQRTGEDRFLSAAEAGGRHLIAISDQTGNGRLIHHHAPGGESLHYLGWCHGPPGTARLFHQLHSTTGEQRWAEAAESLLTGLLETGIPTARADGFWNNVGRCCGDAGVAEFAQDLIELGHDPDGRVGRLRDACTEHIVGSAVETDTGFGEGLSWPHSENRVRPDEIRASIGLMQGAAGIGLWLLRAGNPPPSDGAAALRLPDDLDLPTGAAGPD